MATFVIGIAGPRDCGKSTVAKILETHLLAKGFTVKTLETNQIIKDKLCDSFSMRNTACWIDTMKKENPYVRFLLEQTGVYLRKNDPDFMFNWIINQCAKIQHDFTLVSGVRRLAETAAVKKLNGVILRIYRTTGFDCEPSEDELAYIPQDYTINNSEDLVALGNYVEMLGDRIIQTRKEMNEDTR